MRRDGLGRATEDVLASIPGWFQKQDQTLFRWFLTEQLYAGERGDLAELGVYLGKSAVLIGDYVFAGETFTVIDLFEETASDDLNREENQTAYPDLSQEAFEANYLRVHIALPTVIRGFSQSIAEHVPAGTHRFVHIDASHLYAQVRGDLAASRSIMAPGGVIAFDDIRSAHTPGVAAAVWEAITRESLNVLVVGEHKLYATWSDPTVWLERLQAWLPTSGLTWELQEVAGRPALRVGPKPRPAPPARP